MNVSLWSRKKHLKGGLVIQGNQLDDWLLLQVWEGVVRETFFQSYLNRSRL